MGPNENGNSSVHYRLRQKKVKDRVIVKFVRRDKRNVIYKQRSQLHGKDT